MNNRDNLDLDSLAYYRWRVGRKVPRNIYAQIGSNPEDSDPDIGRMDTADLAANVVDTHNYVLDAAP